MSGYFSLQWHITNKCDQKCKHCYIFNSGKPIPTEEWSMENANRLLTDYVDFCSRYDKLPHISLTGGDPILHKHFWEIVSLIKMYKIPFNVLGNPFHLTPEVIRRLKAAGCRHYQISLDGLEETHDLMRKPGSFQAGLDAIDLLYENGLSPVVMTTVSRVNWLEIPRLTRIIVEHHAEKCAFARYCPTHGDTEFNLTPDEYHSFLNTMWGVYEELANRGTTFTLKDHLWKIILDEKGLLSLKDDGIVYDGCHCGISHLTLLEDGTAYACRRMDSPVGHFPEQSIEEIFFGEQESLYRQIDNIEGCKDCKLLNYCRGCRAVAYGSANGNVFAKDPQCWICN